MLRLRAVERLRGIHATRVADVGTVGRAGYDFALFGGLPTHAAEIRRRVSSDALDPLNFLVGVGGGGPGCHRDRGGVIQGRGGRGCMAC